MAVAAALYGDRNDEQHEPPRPPEPPRSPEPPRRPQPTKPTWHIISKDGRPPSRVHSSPPKDAPDVIRYAANNSIEFLRKLLRTNPREINHKDSNNQTAIFYSARGGDLDCTAILLEYDADLSVENDDGATPLHTAAEGGNKDIILLLLGRVKYQINKETKTGETAVTLAATHEHPEACAKPRTRTADSGQRTADSGQRHRH